MEKISKAEDLLNVPGYYRELGFTPYMPDGTQEVYEENIEDFFKAMVSRQNIWVNRSLNEGIAVDDNILLESKFTNVYRELDRNSQYLISQIILDEDLEDDDLIWKMMFYRLFNNPNTFKYIERTRGFKAGIPLLHEWNPKDFIASIKEIRAGESDNINGNPFTNAYLINSMACPGKTRDQCYTGKVIPTLFEDIHSIVAEIINSETPEDVIKRLEQLPGVSGFISHELYQDLTYIAIYTDRKLFKWDQDDYTNVGPGCDMGLRLTFPSTAGNKAKVKRISELRDLANDFYLPDLGFLFLSWNKEFGEYTVSNEGKVSLHQIEMWLCEYQKYWKMKVGSGKQRSKFIPKEKGKDYSFYLY